MRGYVWCLYFNRYNILPFLDSIFRLYEHVAVQDAKIIEQAENLMKRNQNCTNNNSSSMPVEGLYFNKNRSHLILILCSESTKPKKSWFSSK